MHVRTYARICHSRPVIRQLRFFRRNPTGEALVTKYVRTFYVNSLENGRSLKRDTGADSLSPRAYERYSRRTEVLCDDIGRTPVL